METWAFKMCLLFKGPGSVSKRNANSRTRTTFFEVQNTFVLGGPQPQTEYWVATWDRGHPVMAESRERERAYYFWHTSSLRYKEY